MRFVAANALRPPHSPSLSLWLYALGGLRAVLGASFLGCSFSLQMMRSQRVKFSCLKALGHDFETWVRYKLTLILPPGIKMGGIGFTGGRTFKNRRCLKEKTAWRRRRQWCIDAFKCATYWPLSKMRGAKQDSSATFLWDTPAIRSGTTWPRAETWYRSQWITDYFKIWKFPLFIRQMKQTASFGFYR